MAMRQVVSQKIVPFDSHRKEFSIEIPQGFLVNEDKARVQALWKRFQCSAHQLCKARNSIMASRYHRKQCFRAGMEKLCHEFSLHTETLKVSFRSHPSSDPKQKKKETYSLRFFQLTEIPDACRNAPFCVAEIPSPEVQAFAEFVALEEHPPSSSNSHNNPRIQVQDLESGNLVHAVELNDRDRFLRHPSRSDSDTISSSIRSMTAAHQQPAIPQEYDFHVSTGLPLAMALPEAVAAAAVVVEGEGSHSEPIREYIPCSVVEIL